VAAERSARWFDAPGRDELMAAIESLRPTGDVLELACAPGTWTELLAPNASSVTAIHAAPEMLALRTRSVPTPSSSPVRPPPIVRRQLADGRSFNVLKIPHEPGALEQRLERLGWRITVTPTSGPFYWGTGSRSALAERGRGSMSR
jgi:hypothetical protein